MKKVSMIPYLLIFLSALLLEVFLFNFRFWQSRNYRSEEIAEDRLLFAGEYSVDEDGNYILACPGQEDYVLGIDLGETAQPVHNISVDLRCNNGRAGFIVTSSDVTVPIAMEHAEVIVGIMDELEYRELPMRYAGGAEGKRTIISLPETQGLRGLILKMRPMYDAEGLTLSLRTCLVNDRVPFLFSILRVAGLTALLSLLFAFRPASVLWSLSLFDDAKRIRKGFIFALAGFVLMSAVLFFVLTKANVALSPDREIRPFYNDLAGALLKGQLNLDIEPDPKLALLEDPYDLNAREEAGASWLLDYSYYNGKYYVYFGIVPCLFFYVPFRIFGADILSWQVLCLLCPVFMSGVALMLAEWFRRYRPGASVALYSITYLFVISVVTPTQIAANSMTYSVPMFSAIIFFVFGMYFYLGAVRRAEEGSNFQQRLCLGSFLMALIAGCRPQLILAEAVAIPLLLPLMFGRKKERGVNIFPKNIMSVAGPHIAVAIGLMLYNYLRFDSVTEFGLSYLLTLFMGRSDFRLINSLAGLQFYLFRFPVGKAGFPYVDFCPLRWDNPYAIVDGVTGAGLFFMYPLLFLSVLLFITGWKDTDRRRRELYAMGRISFGAGVVLLLLVSNMMGLLERYRLDFMLFFALSAASVLIMYRPSLVKRHKKAAVRLCSALLVFGVIACCWAYLVPTEVSDLRNVNQEFYTKMAALVEFWR